MSQQRQIPGPGERRSPRGRPAARPRPRRADSARAAVVHESNSASDAEACRRHATHKKPRAVRGQHMIVIDADTARSESPSPTRPGALSSTSVGGFCITPLLYVAGWPLPSARRRPCAVMVRRRCPSGPHIPHNAWPATRRATEVCSSPRSERSCVPGSTTRSTTCARRPWPQPGSSDALRGGRTCTSRTCVPVRGSVWVNRARHGSGGTAASGGREPVRSPALRSVASGGIDAAEYPADEVLAEGEVGILLEGVVEEEGDSCPVPE